MSESNIARNDVPPVTRTATRYSVATMGFDPIERRALKGVLAISEQHTPAFRHFVAVPHRYPHIVIVNGDDAEAMRKWNHFERSGKRKKVYAIFLSREPDAQGRQYVLPKPTQAASLLALLAHVVAENHGPVTVPGVRAREPLILLSTNETSQFVTRPTTPQPVEHARPRFPALVVENSLPLRIQLKRLLEQNGARVDFAGSGARALERIEGQRYAVILVDGGLCGEDGYDLCSRIRNHPGQLRTPIVMLTSSSVTGDRMKGRLAGCDRYLLKPVQDDLLKQMVTELVQADSSNA
jgi:two-component system, cell cycle response regulator